MLENDIHQQNYQLTDSQMKRIRFLMNCQNFKSMSIFVDRLLRHEYFRMNNSIKREESLTKEWNIRLFEDDNIFII